MDFGRRARLLLRRWFLLLPLLTLTVLCTWWVGQGVNPLYEVRTTAVVVYGAQPYYKALYGSPAHTNQVLSVVLDDPQVRERLAKRGLDPDYTIFAQDRRSVLEVTVRSRTPEAAQATAEAVLETGAQQLLERQEAAGIPASARFGLRVLQPPSRTDTTPWRVRNMAAVAGLGTVVTVVLTLRAGALVRGLRSATALAGRPQVHRESAGRP